MTARMPLHSISPKARRFKRQNTKKRRKIIRSIRFPRYEQKKKKKNTMIIIIKKNDSFEIVRPIYHLHTHAYTHIRVFYSFFIIIFFFFSSTRCTETSWKMRQRKWKNDKNVTRSMERARWNGGEGGREGEGWQNVEPSS